MKGHELPNRPDAPEQDRSGEILAEAKRTLDLVYGPGLFELLYGAGEEDLTEEELRDLERECEEELALLRHELSDDEPF